MKRQIMEFLGTFFFILTIAMTANPFAIASMLMAWIYIGSHVSGSHYNPMLSFAIALRGRLRWELVPSYMIAQVLGGFTAFLTASFLKGHVVLPAPSVGVSFWQAFLVEVLLSFAFALIVLTIATSDKYRGNQVFGFAIGFTIPALATLGGPISGGLFNPAIALGSAFFGLLKGLPVVWSDVALYVGGAFVGAFLAAYAFRHFIEEI